jgi:cytoskeletal protein RodZ
MLRGIVIGAVGLCGGILVLAAVQRHSRRTDEGAPATTTATTTATATATATTTATTTATPTATPTPTAKTTPAATDTAATGTLRLQRPAVPGAVWVDGTRLRASSAVIQCGKHEVKVGARGKVHTIDVPCGGEVRVAR